MKFSDRVKALALPLDEVIVIGSGLLDQLGLREARDIDLAVTPGLFDKLVATGNYQTGIINGDRYCRNQIVEIWTGWHSDMPYEVLQKSVEMRDEVQFVSSAILVAKKRQRGSEKDLHDIALLEEYYAGL